METKLTASTSFLPSTYEVPVDNKYMKWEQGENRFRILTSPILGYEWWTDGPDGARKPNRVPMGQGIPTDKVENPEDIRHFWAMVVYNYRDKRVQILEITQRSIQKTLYAIARDPEWGTPVNMYDISILRSGTTKEDTRYEIVPKPPKPTDPAITEEFATTYINLTALYSGKDPFVRELTMDNPDEAVDDSEQLADEVEAGLQAEAEAVRKPYVPIPKRGYKAGI